MKEPASDYVHALTPIGQISRIFTDEVIEKKRQKNSSAMIGSIRLICVAPWT